MRLTKHACSLVHSIHYGTIMAASGIDRRRGRLPHGRPPRSPAMRRLTFVAVVHARGWSACRHALSSYLLHARATPVVVLLPLARPPNPSPSLASPGSHVHIGRSPAFSTFSSQSLMPLLAHRSRTAYPSRSSRSRSRSLERVSEGIPTKSHDDATAAASTAVARHSKERCEV